MPGKRKRSSSARKDTAPAKNPRRAVTLLENAAKTHSQEQSLFFRLPRELRDMIYTEIFIPPTTIHLAWVGGRKRKFRSFLCKLPQEHQLEKTRSGDLCYACRIRHYSCSTRSRPRPSKNVKPTPTPAEMVNVRAMPMLRSCRRVYIEAIDMLYQANDFYLENPRTLIELPKYVPQPHLSAIRSLYLESPAYNNSWTSEDLLLRWKGVVDTLKGFHGLRSLCIILRPWFGLDVEKDALLEPIRIGKLPVAPRIIFAPVVRMMPAMIMESLCPQHKTLYI
ncbi:hypothetical protein BDW62DRAFT_193424 [Aspergillus aurantiobrunneus]